MDPRLLRLYNDELAYMREMGAEFAQTFPKIAGRLGMQAGEVADPHVERLLEGVAFLAARVQLKLQARFPDFTQHLLEIVYPHFLAPIPSMAIARFEPDGEAGRLEKGYLIPRGTKLLSGLAAGATTHCQFRTAHDIHLWPVRVVSVDYYAAPSQISSLRLPERRATKAVLRLRLATTNGRPFDRLALRSLPVHLTGAGGIGAALTEQILADTVAMVARPVVRPAPWQEVIERPALRQLGLDPTHALLPAVPRSFDGYRLLQEYFTLPERALFVEIGSLADAMAQSSTDEIELLFMLRNVQPRLERHLGPANVALFATPIVNLYERPADRVHLSERRYEHHVAVDRIRPLDVELHTILEVKGEGDESTGSIAFQPFYSSVDRGRSQEQGAYYTLRRERRLLSARQRQMGPRTGYTGSEVFLSLVDRNAAPFSTELRQLQVQCLCSNRDLPLLMPVGRSETDFTLEIGAPVSSVRCLVGPTAPRPSAAEGDVAWKLISHLSFNYLSITDSTEEDRDGADGLRELLRLYADSTEPGVTRQIEGIRNISSRPIVRRLPGGGQAAVARGIEIELLVDESAFEGTGCFPLGAVLSHFFAKHVSINSFVETVLSTQQRGAVMRWPMMSGLRPLA
jgi:type VI secretion system protein ImpG